MGVDGAQFFAKNRNLHLRKLRLDEVLLLMSIINFDAIQEYEAADHHVLKKRTESIFKE